MTSASDGRFEGGLWWNGGTWTLRSVPVEGGALPETGTPWRRVPGWLLLPLAPVVGGAFVVALPVVGAILVAQAVARRALARGGQAVTELAATVAVPAQRPGEAHLTGAADEAPVPPAATVEGPIAPEPLDEVEAAVRARQAGRPQDP